MSFNDEATLRRTQQRCSCLGSAQHARNANCEDADGAYACSK